MEGSNSATDPQAALQQTLALLKARDDTSKFVGLSVLRSLLDTNAELRSSKDVISTCWNAIPNMFLTKLLKSKIAKDEEDAKSLRHLAVAVIHIFANLLPVEEVSLVKMTELTLPLVQCIPNLDEEAQAFSFQTLKCIASSPAGSTAIASVADTAWPWLSSSDVREIVFFAKETIRIFAISQRSGGMDPAMLKKWGTRFDTLIIRVKGLDKSALIEVVADLASELQTLDPFPSWPIDARSLLPTVREVMLKKTSSNVRNNVTLFVANLLRSSPEDSSEYMDTLFRSDEGYQGPDSKPFAYYFINLILIDIRTTIPSLMEILASPSYASTAFRISAAYDIASSFILYLLRNIGPETNFTRNAAPMILAPDLLLRLRRDFSETFSLTLEFFRDRWEATETGVSGLAPEARMDPNTPLALTWDNPFMTPSEDPIILSGLRALSLWLREDENPQLHAQAVGIMDMLIPLYSSSTSPDTRVDFRHPILTALYGIFAQAEDSEEGVQAFLDHKGWPVLAVDLADCFEQLKVRGSFPEHTDTLIRVLIVVVESRAVPQVPKAWLDLVHTLANATIPDVRTQGVTFDIFIGGWNLAVSLIIKAAPNIRKTVKRDEERIVEKSRNMLRGWKDSEERMEAIVEVLGGLDGENAMFYD